VLLGTMSLDLFAVLLGGATALLPVYARDILDAGPRGLGLLRSPGRRGAGDVDLPRRYPLRRRNRPALFRTVMSSGGHDRVRPLHQLRALARRPRRSRRVGRGQLVIRARSSRSGRGRDARPRQRRALAVHRTSNQLGAFESGLVAALLGTVPSCCSAASARSPSPSLDVLSLNCAAFTG